MESASTGMVVLAIRSHDAGLRAAFDCYSHLFASAADKDISFAQRVERLRGAEQAKQELEAAISRLHASRAATVGVMPEQWFLDSGRSQARYAFMNGLFDTARLQERLEEERDQLAGELYAYCEALLLQQGGPGDYILFWNVGGLAANVILQNH